MDRTDHPAGDGVPPVPPINKTVPKGVRARVIGVVGSESP